MAFTMPVHKLTHPMTPFDCGQQLCDIYSQMSCIPIDPMTQLLFSKGNKQANTLKIMITKLTCASWTAAILIDASLIVMLSTSLAEFKAF